MLSKMAQPNNVGGSGGATAGSGRRIPLTLSGGGSSSGGGGSTVSKLQQAAGSNGRSKSPQNSNAGKKNELSGAAIGPFVSIKKSNLSQQRSSSTSSTASTASSASAATAVSKDDEKKSQNGVSKSTNNNQKSAQNGSGAVVVKEQQKPKEKPAENKELPKTESKDEAKPSKRDNEKDTKATAPKAAETKPNQVAALDVIEIDDEPEVVKISTTTATPTSERKSSRRAGQQKSPIKPQQSESPVQKKQPEAVVVEMAHAVEDVEMEPLTVDASPIRRVASGAQPTATSTPGRNLFGFRSSSSSSKQTNEVELAAQTSSSPSIAPARNFAQISGRRSIRPVATLTPGKLGSYRCINNSGLDTSNCTNTSMNATVGSEIHNSSSFSFSFFGRGRKRERTPPPLSGSQSTNDLAQDVEMSPPKRARFELFSLSLASPFSMLRSRFSKATISTPSSRPRHEQTPPTGDDEEEGGEVQNVSGIVIQEEEEQQLNKSTASKEVTVGQEAGLETPKKSGTPVKNMVEEKEQKVDDQGDVEVADLPATDAELPVESEGANRSRCAIM